MAAPRPRPQRLLMTLLPAAEQIEVFVIDGRFTFHPPTDADTLVDGGWAVPGLVDAHAHLRLFSPAPEDAGAAEQVWASARAQAAAGVLALREPGGPGYESADVAGDDVPHITTAGRMLHAPGRYFDMGRATPPEDLLTAAQEELARSGGWVKVITDWFEPGADEPITSSYLPRDLQRLADHVHALGGRLAAHASCRASVEACLAAGVDSLEHALGLRAEHLDRVAELGTALVPTLIIRPGVVQMTGQMIGDAGREQIDREFDGLGSVLVEAVRRGITVLAGTDAGMVPHGLVAQEVAALAAAGLTPEDALGAGSWVGRSWLGLPGVEEGAPADLVVFADDPREDLSELTRPRLVMRAGRILAGPERGAGQGRS